eukprot:CAMPEP_0179491610 /NCGR_PEP_ID=MMETSP0799-20121207/66193_1 /TAXON_ID=46947 /ORGANISM="Geminigera cryophila, Strain CCMP2564" /LENGTH=165 /DNA_ID=CAMNT_0021308099 /DNA_START=51 /DNA_END=544 /DNA_ORIENTATION=+
MSTTLRNGTSSAVKDIHADVLMCVCVYVCARVCWHSAAQRNVKRSQGVTRRRAPPVVVRQSKTWHRYFEEHATAFRAYNAGVPHATVPSKLICQMPGCNRLFAIHPLPSAATAHNATAAAKRQQQDSLALDTTDARRSKKEKRGFVQDVHEYLWDHEGETVTCPV